MKDEVKKLLENVSDTYYDFVEGALIEAEKDESYAEKLIDYLKNNPDATTSEIIKYETEEIFGIKPIS